MNLRYPDRDIAKYLCMYQYGGIYFDTDFRFYRAINQNLLSHTCILGIEDEDMPELGGGPKLGNAFIGTELVDRIFARFRKGEISYACQLSGPSALTAFLRNHNRYKEIVTTLPREFHLTGARDLETIGVHLMWGSWCDMSLLYKLKNRTQRLLSATLA